MNTAKTFADRVIAIARTIPVGRVATYGAIARAAGGGGQAARSVTAILGKASERGIDIPFHRIVYAGGKIWLDDQHRSERLRRYKAEGIVVGGDGRIENFAALEMTFR